MLKNSDWHGCKVSYNSFCLLDISPAWKFVKQISNENYLYFILIGNKLNVTGFSKDVAFSTKKLSKVSKKCTLMVNSETCRFLKGEKTFCLNELSEFFSFMH